MFNIPALSETYWLDIYNEHLLDVGVIYYYNKGLATDDYQFSWYGSPRWLNSFTSAAILNVVTVASPYPVDVRSSLYYSRVFFSRSSNSSQEPVSHLHYIVTVANVMVILMSNCWGDINL